MGRAIAFVTLLVICSFSFVFWRLSRRPSGGPPASGHRPALLDVRDDGSVEAVVRRLAIFEQRLIDEEQRSQKLMSDVKSLTSERDDLETQVNGLQDEVHRLRKELADVTPRPTPPAGNAPATNAPNAPPSNVPPDTRTGTPP